MSNITFQETGKSIHSMNSDLVIEELAVAESEVGEAGHASEDVLEAFTGQLCRGKVKLADPRVLPFHLSHELVLQAWEREAVG